MHWQPTSCLGSPRDTLCYMTTLSFARHQYHIPGLLSLQVCDPKKLIFLDLYNS